MKESRLPDALIAKNSVEFEKTTQAIKKALEQISKNKELKPTQSLLAKLSGCTRGTLNNRIWPNTELNKIKTERQNLSLNSKRSISTFENQESEVEKLKMQLNLCRTENARLHEKNEMINRDLKHTKDLLEDFIKQSKNSSDTKKPSSPVKVISLVKPPSSL